MKRIKLTRGKYAIVDDADYNKVKDYSWYARYDGWNYYALHGYWENNKRKTLYMARLIMDAPTGVVVDHINGNGLDNRRMNLRICPTGFNTMNRKLPRNNTTGYKGVTRRKNEKKYVAQIRYRRQNYTLGRFEDPKDAARAYNEAAKKFFGEYAQLNVL